MVDVGKRASRPDGQPAEIGQAPVFGRACSRGVSTTTRHSAGCCAPTRARKGLERALRLFLRRIWMEQEETYTTAGVVAVAVWERPEEWKLSALRQLLLAPVMLRTFGRHLPRSRARS